MDFLINYSPYILHSPYIVNAPTVFVLAFVLHSEMAIIRSNIVTNQTLCKIQQPISYLAFV